MGSIICSRCGKTIKEGEKYVPYYHRGNPKARFRIYGLTFMNFCEKCAKDLNLKYKEGLVAQRKFVHSFSAGCVEGRRHAENMGDGLSKGLS